MSLELNEAIDRAIKKKLPFAREMMDIQEGSIEEHRLIQVMESLYFLGRMDGMEKASEILLKPLGE